MVYFWGEVGFELLGLGSDVVASLVERADQGALHGAFDGCDTIIHLAADGRPSASSSGKSSCFNVYLSPALSLPFGLARLDTACAVRPTTYLQSRCQAECRLHFRGFAEQYPGHPSGRGM